jgi:integrase
MKFGRHIRRVRQGSPVDGEVAGMTWREVDESGVWTLPMARSKTKSEVVRPLSAMTLRIINEQPQVFPGRLMAGLRGRP